MGKLKEVWIGLFVALGIFALIVSINYLKSGNFIDRQNTFYVKYKNASGLTESKPIFISGVNIGYIDRLTLQEDGQVLAELKIDRSYKMPKNSIARLSSVDILGNKAIVIFPSKSKEYAIDGDTLTPEAERGIAERFDPIQRNVQTVLENLDLVLGNLNKLMSSRAIRNFHKTLDNTAKISEQVRITSEEFNENIQEDAKNIRQALENFKEFSIVLKNNSKNIDESLKNLKAISTKINKSHPDSILIEMRSSFTSLSDLLKKIQDQQGTFGKLIRDSTLYTNLNQSIKKADTLLLDIKKHPKRYVHFSLFGKRNK